LGGRNGRGSESCLDVTGEEFLEFEPGLSGARFDLAKERIREFEPGSLGDILA
jgi:hypothetical protein